MDCRPEPPCVVTDIPKRDRHSHLIAIYNIGFKNSYATPMLGLVFCGDLVHKFRRIVGKPNFSDHFKHIFKGYKKKFGYNMDTRRQ